MPFDSLKNTTLAATDMELYVFSSKNLTNIWAGVGAQTWAVSDDQAKNRGIVTKAKDLRIGSFGILYCVQTQALTVPFLVSSVPEAAGVVTDIWPEEWHLPFGILPLGSPRKQMGKEMIAALPCVTSTQKQWNNVIRTQGQFAFQPSHIEPEDWEQIIRCLT